MLSIMLAGCQGESKELSLSVVLNNGTAYEIQRIVFHTYGNRPYYFTIADTPLAPGEARQVDVALNWTADRGEDSRWYADAQASDAEDRYDATPIELNENVIGYDILYDADTDFVFEPIYE